MTKVTLDPNPNDPRNIAIILAQFDKMTAILNGQLDASNLVGGQVNQDGVGLWAGFKQMGSAPLIVGLTPTEVTAMRITTPTLPVACKALILAQVCCNVIVTDRQVWGLDCRVDGTVVADTGPIGISPMSSGSSWYTYASPTLAKITPLAAGAHTLTFFATRYSGSAGVNENVHQAQSFAMIYGA